MQIEALPEISEAVGDQIEVYMDGGIIQGIDVLKALALGAKMVNDEFIERQIDRTTNEIFFYC